MSRELRPLPDNAGARSPQWIKHPSNGIRRPALHELSEAPGSSGQLTEGSIEAEIGAANATPT
ncbi:hypothetical protein BQ8794_220221 [Mesorhizobium prunaredense]|uniref:Uncharacterized protein n=1 Tax=Mesorhizobium prunaredense TaxID=1631249 RepID=A0A1R3VA40_9HYPH|nr:hypothetical protein BQ8794_220221 [Mesorhizobium prunaredense]